MIVRPPLTALVITYNEVDQIVACLESLQWVDEIYLVDSFSSDGTVELVRERFPSVVIEQREYFGAGAQRNYALDRLSNDWVLVVDADERVSPALRAEIEQALAAPRFWAWEIRRSNVVGTNRALRFSGLASDYVTRLFHRRHARYQNRRVHAEVDVEGELGRLEAPLVHFYVRSYEHLMERMVRYGLWGAANHFRRGKRAGIISVVWHPSWRFSRDYVIRGGFLDGADGFIVCACHSLYTFWKYVRLRELTQLESRGIPVRLPRFDEDPQRWVRPWEAGANDAVPGAGTRK